MEPRINRRLLLSLAVLSLLVSSEVLGAQLTPLLYRGQLGAVLKDASLPPTLRKDLMSGLTNRIVIRVTLLNPTQVIAQKLVGITVKYDLWEETFEVKVSVDDAPVSVGTCQSVAEVIAMLTDLNLPGLFAVDPATAGKSSTLTAEILFDPIEKARLEEIRKWVAENDRPAAQDATSVGSGLPAPRSTSARLFNKIFEQYAAGASVAAAWQQTVSSEPFKLTELRDAP
ncbi:MAG TPA: hypothetical protein VH209_05860 [Steroidobacteraceae bacterium]|jgi:hypothetical protein|nr:hypothetical protein [Steroidobacteraceae bacterium]